MTRSGRICIKFTKNLVKLYLESPNGVEFSRGLERKDRTQNIDAFLDFEQFQNSRRVYNSMNQHKLHKINVGFVN